MTEDCRDLIALRRAWHPGDDEGFEDRLHAWWERERHQRRAVVAYEDDAPVGMANAQIFSRMPAPGKPDARWLYVANVYVLDSHRRRGIGSALTLDLVDFARANGMVRVVLAPSPMSIPMYQSLGFRPADDLMRLDMPMQETPWHA
ncbi:GNAT family N-acetyltransferase [Nocardioides humilatus]|uniref:GNAT family N-acetyltransferase n=1 Tax=Nocardioides humilatus TaxID=2607660 RepID=UPI001CB72B48|nr:GNAT family N-acetyltransferase [Nocardioides humilatus]